MSHIVSLPFSLGQIICRRGVYEYALLYGFHYYKDYK